MTCLAVQWGILLHAGHIFGLRTGLTFIPFRLQTFAVPEPGSAGAYVSAYTANNHPFPTRSEGHASLTAVDG